MWTKLFLAGLLIAGAACVKLDLSQILFGTCVEACGAGCPEGYTCQSNGCGHTCQPVAEATNLRALRQFFGICAEMCGLGCPTGQTCVSNGCGHVCSGDLAIAKKQLIACPAIGCLNPCSNGYVLDARGCPSCTCL